MILSTGAVLALGPHLLQSAEDATPGHAPPPVATAAATPAPVDPPTNAATLADAQRRHILSTLQQCDWVIEGAHGAAKALGLNPNTLRSRMKKLGIRRTEPAS